MRKKILASLFFTLALGILLYSAFISGYLGRNHPTPSPFTSPLPPNPPNYSAIEPNLYVGGFVPAPPPGTTAVLTLSFNKDPYTTEAYLSSSIPDIAPAPSLEWLAQQVAFVADQQSLGRCTYIHCDAGMSRSALVTAAYLMFRDHITRDQAITYLRDRRPVIHPNPAFMELLLQWEQLLNTKPPATP